MRKYYTALLSLLVNAALGQVTSWKTGVKMDDMIFPSYILSHAAWPANEDEDVEVEGEPYHIINEDGTSQVVVVLELSQAARVKIELLPSEMNTHSVYEANLGKGNYGIYPKVNYRYDLMRNQRQSTPVNLVFQLSVSGKKIGQQTQTISMRAVSECPYQFVNEADEPDEDLSEMFAAYVNEDDPRIDSFLKEALKTGLVDSFQGYQGSEDEVVKQIAAIWAAMGHRGIKYSSITNTSNTSKSVFSQRVRSFGEVLDSDQANCVDGSAFMCSVFKSIDLKPFLVKVPGHCYVGVYLDEQKNKPYVIETTMIGSSGLRGLVVGSDQAQVKATDSLEGASNYAVKAYNASIKKFNQGGSGYVLVDIEDARQHIKPLGR